MKDPFEKLSPEEVSTRIRAAEAHLAESELEDITTGDIVPDDLPQPDLYGPTPDKLEYRPEDWELPE